MCDPISLDKRKKNSNEVVSEKKEICPKTSKYIQCTDGKELKMIPLQCKRFDCPVCGARRIAMERDRYHKMLKAYWDELQVLYPDRFKKGGKYWVKMLSLTCPGKDYRVAGYEHDECASTYYGDTRPQMAYKDMQHHYNKLATMLRKHFPNMNPVRFYEPQRDGYPHFHVILVGPDANKRGLLEFCRKYWTDEYQMGNVDIAKMDRGIGGALNYAVKYLTKMTRGLVHLPKGAKVINAAHKLYKYAEKRVSIFIKTKMGNYDHDKGFLEPFWEIPDTRPLIQLEEDRLKKNFDELVDFFGSRDQMKQLEFDF